MTWSTSSPPRPTANKQAIADLARRRLAASPYRTIQRLSCQFDGQVLTLSGRLPSFYQNQLAQEAVAGLDGVDRVDNRVEVFPEPEEPGRKFDAAP